MGQEGESQIHVFLSCHQTHKELSSPPGIGYICLPVTANRDKPFRYWQVLLTHLFWVEGVP